VKLIDETDLLCDLFYHYIRTAKRFGGGGHLQSYQVLVGALVIIAPEQAAQISGTNATFLRHLVEAFQSQVMPLYMLVALLIGRKSPAVLNPKRRVRLVDLEEEAFQQACAYLCAVMGSFDSVGNEFIKEVLHLLGWENLSNVARGQASRLQ
jgi:hypothetical protein